MTDIIWPPGLYPRSMTWTLVRNQERATNPYTRTVQRNDRGGDLWSCRIEMPELSPKRSGLMTSWLDQISKAGNAGLVPVFQNKLDSDFHRVLGANICPRWADGDLAQWFPGTGIYPQVQDGLLRIQNSGSTGLIARRALTVAAGQRYFVAFDVPPHAGNLTLVIRSGSGAADLLLDTSGTQILPGRFSVVVVPTNNQLYLYIFNLNSVSSEVFTGDITVCQTLLVREAASAGSNAIRVSGGGNYPGFGVLGFNGLRPGQFFNLRTTGGLELKRATKHINLVGFDEGPVTPNVAGGRFEPALRASISAFRAVEHFPVCRMILNEAVSSANISAPLRSGFAFEMIEDPTT